ncbi:flagellar FlbD family protein [Gottschalkia purinilytica]|uniref:Flagellar FlbD family protein n=1 Tax=Gottschalkia purinilytica TaxID=1503 RepID=A0A0L0WBS8_GOTPU|nr:flagellar FlbD family protein [Gottschalkia purinilytica]KNF08820.1 flagellar FlbD family protein [Gottschalkia purinilytica]
MIRVKRLNDKEFVVNCDLIEFIEETPDVVITLTTGKKIVVKDTIEEVIEKVIEYKNQIFIHSEILGKEV